MVEERKPPKKITVEIPQNLYERFMEVATKKFGYYGALKRGIVEAMKLWLEKEEK